MMKCPVCEQDDVVPYGKEWQKQSSVFKRFIELTKPLWYKNLYQCHVCQSRWKGPEVELRKE